LPRCGAAPEQGAADQSEENHAPWLIQGCSAQEYRSSVAISLNSTGEFQSPQEEDRQKLD
jgi:hypothetical protein